MKNNQTSDKNKKTNQTSRRSFLKRLWGVLGIIAGVEFLWAGSSFLRPGHTSKKDTRKKLVTAGNVSDFRPGDVYPFRNGLFYLVRFEDGGFMAFSLKCTHLGCSVLWDDSEKIFNCPCHASSFGKYGEVINPPAPRPLDVYPVFVEEGFVKVDAGNPQRRKSFNVDQIVYA